MSLAELMGWRNPTQAQLDKMAAIVKALGENAKEVSEMVTAALGLMAHIESLKADVAALQKQVAALEARGEFVSDLTAAGIPAEVAGTKK